MRGENICPVNSHVSLRGSGKVDPTKRDMQTLYRTLQIPISYFRAGHTRMGEVTVSWAGHISSPPPTHQNFQRRQRLYALCFIIWQWSTLVATLRVRRVAQRHNIRERRSRGL